MTERRALERWNVRIGPGLGIAAGFVGLILLAVAAMILFQKFRGEPISRPQWDAFPSPALERTPLRPTDAPIISDRPPEGIDAAMQSVAAQGEAAWEPAS